MTHAQHNSVEVGTSDTHGAVLLSPATRRRHLHVIGQTGTGKTTLILNLVAQGLAAGEGIALLDPLGTLAPAALACVPSNRAHELVYLDPTDLERPIGFNVLDRVPSDRRPTVTDDVVSAFKVARRLDPFSSPWTPGWMGLAHYMLKRYSDALPLLRECVARAPNFRGAHVWMAATYVRLGQLDDAREAAAEVLRVEPTYSISGVQKQLSVFKQPEHAEHLFEALRKAGLPE
jgi:hypothetical protein